ncbi:hypothetical protein ALI144C_06575 [Actinosynnema sp. ALI-1.44]|nr:hypothetical protein ALI144C_06575 [Actinosynnema sp. ALI-1.44]
MPVRIDTEVLNRKESPVTVGTLVVPSEAELDLDCEFGVERATAPSSWFFVTNFDGVPPDELSGD